MEILKFVIKTVMNSWLAVDEYCNYCVRDMFSFKFLTVNIRPSSSGRNDIFFYSRVKCSNGHIIFCRIESENNTNCANSQAASNRRRRDTTRVTRKYVPGTTTGGVTRINRKPYSFVLYIIFSGRRFDLQHPTRLASPSTVRDVEVKKYNTMRDGKPIWMARSRLRLFATSKANQICCDF